MADSGISDISNIKEKLEKIRTRSDRVIQIINLVTAARSQGGYYYDCKSKRYLK